MMKLLLTVGGLGLLRPGPGTWGSLPPLVMVAGLLAVGVSPLIINLTLASVCVTFSIICLIGGQASFDIFGRHDPGEVVADETAGQSLALLWLPWALPAGDHMGWNVLLLVSAFLLFRLFDIWKPALIGRAQHLRGCRGGFGILIDDILAGLAAGIITQIVWRGLL